jgi:segregation and condensation protein A
MSFSDSHDTTESEAMARRSGAESISASGGPVSASGGPARASGGSTFASGDSAYDVKLPVFEGPLDLLLHLIRQNEVEITDIPIALIGQQYLVYIDLMEELDIDVAAEYLVMAATLALIKSRMLLPPEEDPESGMEIDPRAELVARLLEYQRYKEVAENLAKLRLLGRDIFQVRGPTPEGVPDAERQIDVGLFELIEAFRRVLAEAHDIDHVHAVETENVTVRECMIYVMELLEQSQTIEFMDVFRQDGGGRGQTIPSRSMLVATFLAILELARLTALSVYQGQDELGAPVGAIRLRAATIDPEGPGWYERISDTM